MKKRVKVWQYDMENPALVARLCWRPEEAHVQQAWQDGFYEEVIEVEVEANEDDRSTVLEQAFIKTQETGQFRSTSVGDLLEVDGKFEVVMPFGFMPVDPNG